MSEREEVTVRQLAALLSVRLGTAYALIWDGSVSGRKEEGQWLVDRGSVESYMLRRSLRRAASRNALRRDAIDVNVTSQVADSA